MTPYHRPRSFRNLSLLFLASSFLFATALPAWAAEGWTQQSPLVTPALRWGPTAATDPANNEVVMFGGCKLMAASQNTTLNPCPENVLTGVSTNETYTWSGSNWTQEVPLSSPAARHGASMARDPGTGEIVLFGGIGSNGAFRSDTWVWNGSNWTQKSPASNPSARAWAGMATLENGATEHVILFGGCTGVDGNGNCNTFSDQTWTWDGSDWTQICTTSTSCGGSSNRPTARMVGSQMTQQNSGQVLLFGGFVNSGGATYYDDTYSWSGSAWTKECDPCANIPTASGGALAKVQRGSWGVLMYGGGNNPNSLSDESYFWGGSSWTALSLTPKPAGRQSFAMAFSSSDSRVVVFSGLGNGANYYPVSGTWEYAGS